MRSHRMPAGSRSRSAVRRRQSRHTGANPIERPKVGHRWGPRTWAPGGIITATHAARTQRACRSDLSSDVAGALRGHTCRAACPRPPPASGPRRSGHRCVQGLALSSARPVGPGGTTIQAHCFEGAPLRAPGLVPRPEASNSGVARPAVTVVPQAVAKTPVPYVVVRHIVRLKTLRGDGSQWQGANRRSSYGNRTCPDVTDGPRPRCLDMDSG